MKAAHIKEFTALVAIPHEKRTNKQRIRICELSIAKICDHLNKIDATLEHNAPAMSAAWMSVPIGGRDSGGISNYPWRKK